MTSHRNVWLPYIANEIVDDVLSYLDVHDRNAMLQTCWNLHCVSARRLYMHVCVTAHKARRFFKTISESHMNYGMYTRSLQYSAASNTDAWLTYVLFRDALSHFPELETITLTVRPELSSLLSFIIKKSISGLSTLDKADFETYRGPPGKFALERLRTLNLHGDLRILKLFQFQSLSTLCLSEQLEEEDFLYFLHAVSTNKEGNRNTILKDLTIKFDEAFNTQSMTHIIRNLGEHLPNLRRLTIRCPKINALKTSAILALDPHLFPMLQEFSANDVSVMSPFMYDRSEHENMTIQRKHVHTIGVSHPDLTRIAFGPVQWTRFNQYNEWVNSRCDYEGFSDYIPYTMDNELLFEISYDMDFDVDI